MFSAATQPALRAHAPDLADRLGRILAGLRAVVAARFLRIPGFALLTLPLWTRLNRAAQRFTRLAALFAAGRLPAPRVSKSGGHSKLPPMPVRHGWLLDALRHEAAVYRGQLENLLAEPAMAEFLAASPVAVRLLRPICRMLALPPPGPVPPPALPPAGSAIAPAPSAFPPSAGLVPPLCPRLLARWPWADAQLAESA